MAVPAFLSSSFRAVRVEYDTTQADFIDKIRDELTGAQNPAWTEPSADRFKSPVDGDGRFFELEFVNGANSTKTRCNCYLSTGLSTAGFSRELRRDVSSMLIQAGQYHFYVECNNAEFIMAALLDLLPNSQTAINRNVVFSGSLDTTGFADTVENTRRGVVPDATAAAWIEEIDCLSFFASAPSGVGNDAVPRQTLTGQRLWYPYYVSGPEAGSTHKVRGRAYQMLVVDSRISAGSRIQVPIDDTTLGTFRVTTRPIEAISQRAAIAVRVA